MSENYQFAFAVLAIGLPILAVLMFAASLQRDRNPLGLRRRRNRR